MTQHAENSLTHAAVATKPAKRGFDLERLAAMTLEELLYFVLVGDGRALPRRPATL
jgi:hypothetical protein